MPKKKVTEVTQADIEAASPKKETRREVVYTIMVTGLDDRVKIEAARRELEARQVMRQLIQVDEAGGTIAVPRLFTLWQGDVLERAWQQSIKAAVPNCLIDVKDWSYAPGYPQGEIGEATE